MENILSLAIILSVAFIGGILGRWLRYPRVIGQLVISLLFGIPLINAWFQTGSTQVTIDVLSQFGVILLLFLTGFEMDTVKLKQSGKDAVLIAFFAAIVPFMIGFSIGRLFDQSIVTSVVLGMCLSVTAEGTKTALLIEMKKIKTRVGSIMLAAGVLDDVFEVLFLTIILLLSHTEDVHSLTTFPLRIALFIAVIFLAFRYLPKVIAPLERNHDGIGIFSGSIAIGLVIAIAAEYAGFGAIVGAFIAGLIMQRSFLKKYDRENEERSLRLFSFAFIVPFFFANIGMHTDLHALASDPFLAITVIAGAVFGKLLGTLITKPFTSLSWKQLTLIGWGMNSRGVMELVIAQIAVTYGLISQQLYSVIVCMAIVTTVMFPFVIKHMLATDPKIMD